MSKPSNLRHTVYCPRCHRGGYYYPGEPPDEVGSQGSAGFCEYCDGDRPSPDMTKQGAFDQWWEGNAYPETDRTAAAQAWDAALRWKESGGAMKAADIRFRAIQAGACERYVTPEGYTKLPDIMVKSLNLSCGGYLWFLASVDHWSAWLEADLDNAIGEDKECDDV